MRITRRCVGTVAYLGGLPAVLESFTWSWGQMIQFNAEYLAGDGAYVHLDHATVSLHDYARNSLVRSMRGDWLIMLDTDHAFEPDLCVQLVTLANTLNLDVLTAIYCHRASPNVPVIYNWGGPNDDAVQPMAWWSKEARVLQIGSAGAGTLFVRRSVFERILNELKEEPFTRFDNLGEDHSFAKRLKKLGIPMYAAMNVESRHLQVKAIPLSQYKMPEIDPQNLPPDGTVEAKEMQAYA